MVLSIKLQIMPTTPVIRNMYCQPFPNNAEPRPPATIVLMEMGKRGGGFKKDAEHPY